MHLFEAKSTPVVLFLVAGASAAAAVQPAAVLVGLAVVPAEVGSAVPAVMVDPVVHAVLVAARASRVPVVVVAPAESAEPLVVVAALGASDVAIAVVDVALVALVGGVVLPMFAAATATAGLRPCRPPADYRLAAAVQSLRRQRQ